MRFLFIFLYVFLFFFPSVSHAEKFALLIGNQDYSNNVGPLQNPVNDVNLIAASLKAIGFKPKNIKIIKNADRITILDEVDAFGERLGKVGSGAIGFFYYSGHGAARDGLRNYLVPVGVKRLDRRMWRKSVALDEITRSLQRLAQRAVHFVIFDACRNTLKLPTKGQKGFTPVAERQGMLIAFSSAPGHTASDAGTTSGPYARALADELRRQGIHHLDLFQNVKERVYKLTDGQVPWERNGLLRRVYLSGLPKVKPPEVIETSEEKNPVKPVVGVFQDKFTHGTKFQDCDVCPKMIVVKGGTFTMGSSKSEEGSQDDERPQHKVTIKKFAVGRFEVTFDEWDACVSDGGCNGYKPEDEGWGRGSRPVINVNWDDAKAYVQWLSRKTGKTYRLLTEAEWEYVASAKRSTAFWWGNSISTKQANYDGNRTYRPSKGGFRNKTVPVDSFAANPFGLYNVHGNAWEWVEDCWHKNYRGAPTDGSAWLEANGGDCSARVLRGGSWLSNPLWLRARNRFRLNRDDRYYYRGFRVARTR